MPCSFLKISEGTEKKQTHKQKNRHTNKKTDTQTKNRHTEQNNQKTIKKTKRRKIEK